MAEPRPRNTLFDLVFRAVAEERFPALRDALAAEATVVEDRDAFLLHRGVVELVRDLRPEQGYGDAMPEFVALLHHAYLFWLAGELTVELDRDEVARLLGPAGSSGDGLPGPEVYYARYPGRLIWGAPTPGGVQEPLDGCFLGGTGTQLALTAIFGFHAARVALSVVTAEGPRPSRLARRDGTELFSPVLAGARQAGLYALLGMEELLELAWRTDGAVRAGVAGKRGPS